MKGKTSSIIKPTKTGKSTVKVVSHRPEPTSVSSGRSSKGLSLGVKYAIFTALAVTVAMGLLVIIAYNSARKVVEEEINQAGVRLVQTLATFDISYWKSVAKGELPDTLKYLASSKGESMGLNVPTILNIVIQDINQRALAGISIEQISLIGPKELPPITAENIVMLEGKYREGARGYLVRTRMFKKKILSPESVGQGYVILFLSARKIDDVLNDLFVAFIFPAILSILGGGAIGFFMARWVTQPVKTLMEDMAIVSAGELQHRSRVTSTDEVGVLASAFDKMTADLRIAHQRELETQALEHELNIAREIQNNLLPKEIPVISGYEIAARYYPCFEVSGDYFDILQIDEDNVGIIVADVSGKGVPGAMVMTMARSLIRIESERNLSPSDTLKKVNRILARDLRRGMFITVMYYILNIKTGIIKICSAGHNPLVIWRKGLNRYELVNPNGIAIGFDRGPVFDRTIKEESIQINRDDLAVSFTDGITETMDNDNEEFGAERFYKLIGELKDLEPAQIIDSVITSIEDYKGTAPQHDDITIVCMKKV
jgi:serine phosphatase RsbU (regulator of sigma subunit)